MQTVNSNTFVFIFLAFIVSGCGGNGGDVSTQSLPEVNVIEDAFVIEGNNPITFQTMLFLVELSTPADDYIYGGGYIRNGTATDEDWSPPFYTANDVFNHPYGFMMCLITIPPGYTIGSCFALVAQDTVYEPNETLIFTLDGVSNAELGNKLTSVGTILNDDYGGINDTNVSTCSDAHTNSISCSAEPVISLFPDQDAHHGYTIMSFTKLDSTGADTNSPTDWSCVRDNGTGLVWEAKQIDGLHSSSDTFSWFDSNINTNGGDAGVASLGSCSQAGHCDTEHFVADVNTSGLCGFHDWRLPTADELRSLVDYASLTINAPALDTAYFDPSSSPTDYWTANTVAGVPAYAWVVEFVEGSDQAVEKDKALAVRLVRP